MSASGPTLEQRARIGQRRGNVLALIEHLVEFGVDHLGRKRIDSMYRMRDLADAGAKITFGSDWPVSSPDPILGIYTAAHRALPESPEKSWTPEQRLTPVEALEAYTRAVSAQLELATDLPDFVILSSNPLTGKILDANVVETIIGGQTVFARQ